MWSPAVTGALATRMWFVGSSVGSWRVIRVDPVSGLPLAWISRLEVTEEEAQQPIGGWVLTGVTSFERYVTRAERSLLEGRQESLGRPSATRAALIPIRTGIEYLPAVARRLYHSRDLGEPFDFLTWFEYVPDHAGAFEQLVERLRSAEEWRYVEREVDVRMTWDPPNPATTRVPR